MTEGKNPLIEGIMGQAEEKARKIIADAHEREKNIAVRASREAEEKAGSIKAQAEEKIRQIEEKTEREKRGAERLAELRTMDSLSSRVIEETEKRVRAMAESGKLKDVIPSWIAEAAIGVGESVCIVSSSKALGVTEETLKEAERILKGLTGDTVELRLSTDHILEDGVVVSDEEGRISFRNTVSERLKRFQRDIRKIVQEENAR